MFSVRFGKSEEERKYLLKLSGECLGRQIEFGISHREFERLKERGRNIVSDLKKWRGRAKLVRGDGKEKPHADEKKAHKKSTKHDAPESQHAASH